MYGLIAWLALALTMLFIPLSVHAATISESWDDGDDFRGWEFSSGCYGYNFSLVPDPATGDTLVARVENRLQSCGTSRGNPHARNELRRASDEEASSVYYQQDFWWCSRIYVDRDWPTAEMPVGWVTITQVNVGNRQGHWDPDFKFTIRKNHTWGWDGPGGGNFGPIQRGAWTSLVIRHKRSIGSDGVTEVWMNGKQVVNYHGKNTFTSTNGAMWRFGIYAEDGGGGRAYVLYFDDIQTGPERCEAGGPLGPQPPPKPETPLPPPKNLRLIGEK